jgi:DsbC/DsbD-like thiol-disulfide interchange protein
MKRRGPASTLLIVPLLLVQALPSFSAPTCGGAVPTASPLKSVRLVVVEAGGPGPATLGFYVELEPGWHLYWANPGDAGLAPNVRWTLPAGFTAGPLRHPVPRKTVEGGVVSLEHEGQVLLLSEISPPASGWPAGPWKAEAVLEWMACRESCVTGETAVEAVCPPDAASLAEGCALLERFSPRFPRPLAASGLTLGPGQASWAGSAWLVEVPLSGPRTAEASDFYAYPVDDFVIDNAGVVCREGKIIVPLVPSRGPGSPPPSAVAGVLVVGDVGYEISVALSRGDESRPNAFVPSRSARYDHFLPGLMSIASWR